jgi:hypothetical protein
MKLQSNFQPDIPSKAVSTLLEILLEDPTFECSSYDGSEVVSTTAKRRGASPADTYEHVKYPVYKHRNV